MHNSFPEPSTYVSLFAVYAFAGWIIEVIYRSYTQRKFVNAGFLYGPFVPLYGFGAAAIIIIEHFIYQYNIVIQIIIFAFVLTLLEYFIGFTFEKIFGLKLWDYSDNRFNINGRVCPFFSIFWAFMSILFIRFMHPFVYKAILSSEKILHHTATVLLVAYFSTDTFLSVLLLQRFRRRISYFFTEFIANNNAGMESMLENFKRLLKAFPNLNKYLNKNINDGLKKRVNNLLTTLNKKIIGVIDGRKPFEEEYYNSIKDILNHEEFQKLQHYFHHNSSIYDHVREVSYYSYRICKLLKMDYISAARGGLLHDFFLYDWRNHDVPDLPKEKFHGFAHPKIALDNSLLHFEINRIEKDIILKHMWPLTVTPPRHRESFVVSFVDKYVSSKEFLDEFKRNRSKKSQKKSTT